MLRLVIGVRASSWRRDMRAKKCRRQAAAMREVPGHDRVGSSPNQDHQMVGEGNLSKPNTGWGALSPAGSSCSRHPWQTQRSHISHLIGRGA